METMRKTTARNPNHPHKNFLSLSIVWPYRSESSLAEVLILFIGFQTIYSRSPAKRNCKLLLDVDLVVDS